jgi:hypothetical protein
MRILPCPSEYSLANLNIERGRNEIWTRQVKVIVIKFVELMAL